MLETIATNLWAVEVHKQRGLHLRNRMVVARLRTGGLWVHSPVEIDDALAEQLDALGDVAHIVAPSKFHHLHAAAAKARYPQARLWACPGLAAKRRDVTFDDELCHDAMPWADEMDAVFVGGMPRVCEVVFFHRPSSSLICSDYLFNITEERSSATRLFWRAMGVWRRPGQSRVWRWMTKDRSASAAAAAAVRHWPVRHLVPAHGDVLSTDATPAVEAALRWLD